MTLRNDDIGMCDLCGSEDGPRFPMQAEGGKAWACSTCRAPFPDNPPSQENPMTTTGKPFVVAPKTDADYANKTWGDRYGVDWCYPGDENFITVPSEPEGPPRASLPARVEPDAYLVSRLPDGPDRAVWSVRVESAGRGRWAVRNMSRCLNKSGEWEYEPLPSSREDDWLDTVRWSSLAEATDAALAAEPFLEWNGLTPADVLARAASRPDVAPQPTEEEPGT